MFLEEVKLKKVEKLLAMRAKRRIEELAVTFIPYKDKKFWSVAEWNYMLENVVIHGAEGFYIRTKLFDWDVNVSSCKQA